MTRVPIVDAKTLEKVLRKLGFEFVRQKGSHAIFVHEDGRVATISRNSKKDISRHLTYEILRQIGITPEEFVDLLNKI
jgi:predicted RNA binding protein YcfA (HicA-like mRNA interferase family)